ncbi:MAG: VWA domain-containing protein [Acidobacteriota bacterium]|nr:VWA domain-containing protein [Acidobacteriota bacterium]
MTYRLTCLSLLIFMPFATAQVDRDVQEQIEVKRMLVDVRVIDKNGDPITDLTKSDFELKSRGKTLEIISCNWIDDRMQTAREPGGEIIDLATNDADDERFWAPIPPGNKQELGGRIVVLLVQKSLGDIRYTGVLKSMTPHIRDLMGSLEPSDYIAVFSYDYKLKLHLDLTRAHPYLEKAYTEAVTGADGIPFGNGRGRNLAELIDRYKVEDAVNIEMGMKLIGKALERFAGTKSLIFMGYRMGRQYSSGRMDKRPAYVEAIQALQDSHTAVYALDMVRSSYTNAPSMLKQIARDTGGFYRMARRSPTSVFPRVMRAVQGHYQLVFRIPEDQNKPRYILKVNRKHEEILVRKPINEQDYTF